MQRRQEHLYKILVIGELATGKTSLVKRYVHGIFSQHYRATIGVDFALKVLHWDADTIIRLQLWDIAGQERFGHMTRVYYKEAQGAVIVYDQTRAATFDAVTKWKNDLDAKVELADQTTLPCVLMGNKCDAPRDPSLPSNEKLDLFARENGFTAWYETSAKDNIGVDEAMRSLIAKILQNEERLRGQLENSVEQIDSLDADDGRASSSRRSRSGAFQLSNARQQQSDSMNRQSGGQDSRRRRKSKGCCFN